MNKRSISFFVLLIILSFAGCKGAVYSGQYFAFPPDSKPHENNWDFLGEVIASTKESGPFSQKSLKKIQIYIIDKNKRKLLSDEFHFKCGGIESSIQWETFEKIQIRINEVGSAYVEDAYNKQLLKTGPRLLLDLHYIYDDLSKKFIKSDKTKN